MIIESLTFIDAGDLCKALKISEELAFQYHHYDPIEYDYIESKIYGYFERKLLNLHFANALFKNLKFQSTASAKNKVTIAILTQCSGRSKRRS